MPKAAPHMVNTKHDNKSTVRVILSYFVGERSSILLTYISKRRRCWSPNQT